MRQPPYQSHPEPSRAIQQQPAYHSATAPSSVAESKTRHEYSVIQDIYWGAIWGDFAPRVGIPGALTQALLGYVPLVGTITALRDAVADIRGHDGVGTILNLLAAFPVLGGLAKTADVLHGLHRLHRAYSSHQGNQRQPVEEIRVAAGGRHGYGCLAFFVSLVMVALGVFYGVGVHIASHYVERSWPLGANTAVVGNGMLVVGVGLAVLGFSIGEVICVGSRAWFGVIFLPAAIYVGVLLAGGI
jgi:hypothetical protein